MMPSRTLVPSSALLAVCTWVGAAPQVWPVHQCVPGLEVRQDAEGRRTSESCDLGRPSTPTQNRAPVADWQPLGPPGGDIDDVQVSPTNPNIVLAGLAPALGGGGGLYRSTDGGSSWLSVPSLDGRRVHDLAFAPDGTAYAGTFDGVWRSVDDGATFTNLPLGIGLNDQVFDVDVDPTNPQVLWIGISNALGNQPIRVMRTTDGGSSWVNHTPPLTNLLSCSAIAIDPTNPNRIFAGFRDSIGSGQVWVSTDGGTSWSNRSAGLPGKSVNDLVHDGARLLVGGGQFLGGHDFGLYSSVDDGLTWTPLHSVSWPSLVVQDIALDPQNVNTMFVATVGGGLFRSNDGGAVWAFQVGGIGSLTLNSVSFAPGSSSTIFTGGSSVAVLRSVDGGASFAASSRGIGALDVTSIDSNPLDPDELAVAFQGLNDGGVFTSLDGGLSWTLALLPGTRFRHVRFSPQGTLYAISDGPSTIGTEGLYRRVGAAWSAIGPFQGPLFESQLYGLRVSSNDPDFIVAVGSDFGTAGSEPTVWRTVDGGTNWTKAYEGATSNLPVQDVLVVDAATDTTFVASYTGGFGAGPGGALRSSDSGVTWARSNAGLPSAMSAYSVARSPVDGALYLSNSAAATGVAVWKSVNAGLSWTSTGYVGQAYEVTTDETDPQVLYIAQQGSVRVRRSDDGGATFQAFETGLPTDDLPRDLRRAPSAGGGLLLATSKGSFANELAPGAIGTNFCNAVPNSTGGTATLEATGSAVAADNNLTLVAAGMPTHSAGYFVTSATQNPMGVVPAGSQGRICLGGAIGRYVGPGMVKNSGATGSFDLTIDLTAVPLPVGSAQVLAGDTRSFQAWHRDVNPTSTSNFTVGLAITFQ